MFSGCFSVLLCLLLVVEYVFCEFFDFVDVYMGVFDVVYLV